MMLVNTVEARQPATMPAMKAVLLTLAIILPCLLVGLVSPGVAKPMLTIAIGGTSLWAALDSLRLKLKEYKSPIAAHPFVLFTATVGLWIVVFPVYLVVRSKIQAGVLPRAPNPRERYALYLCVAIWFVPLMLMLLAYFVPRSLNSFQ